MMCREDHTFKDFTSECIVFASFSCRVTSSAWDQRLRNQSMRVKYVKELGTIPAVEYTTVGIGVDEDFYNSGDTRHHPAGLPAMIESDF